MRETPFHSLQDTERDVTGSLNDETLRKFDERLKYLRNLEDKKEKIIKRIDELGKLDDELKTQITRAETLVELEDLYRPFKSKKQTRATKARDKGLEPLAQIILRQDVKQSVKKIAEKYVTDEVKTPDEAINGAKDIIAEIVSDNSTFRKKSDRTPSIPVKSKQRQRTRTPQPSMTSTTITQKTLKEYLRTGFLR